MEKYMGNKAKFCNNIYQEIEKIINIKPNMTLFDAFCGTTNVGRFFKKKKFNIISNDINDLSFVLGKAYIDCCQMPVFEKLYSNEKFSIILNNIKQHSNFKNNIQKLIKENQNTTAKDFLNKNENSKLFEVLTYLTYYCDFSDYDDVKYNFFADNYCAGGKNSRYINLVYLKTLKNIQKKYAKTKIEETLESFFEYPFDEKYIQKAKKYLEELNDGVSVQKIKKMLDKKNLTGERLFFSLEHAKRLDNIFNTICYWKNNNLLNESEYYILLTSLIETVCIFSNTSATYQAFYKELRANTLQDFRLIIPAIDTTKIDSKIYKKDAFDLIAEIEADIIYLDPPYNWRQYDSNYHLLNSIAKFNDIKDKELFQSQIIGASGENRVQKLQYTSFNVRNTFKELLLKQLEKTKCKYIVLSYSDSSSNHEREQINDTIFEIENFFSNKSLFEFYKVVKIKSQNFESRKGNKKENINELLFIAKKSN
ncbi:MAG: DNA adenine methylase [Candidatus Gastranaerophilales bacterium]|nr:DNA adenine methylase [Candidatus Gastranaerophilales bacterium]